MIKTILLGYDDREGCNLRGFYDPEINKVIPTKTISITERDRSSIINNKRNFRVEDGQLIQLKSPTESKRRTRKSKEDLHTITHKGNVYTVSENFTSALALNLGICLHDSKHTCKFWANSDSVWQYLSHNKEDLIGLSKALNAAREDCSRKNYGDAT